MKKTFLLLVAALSLVLYVDAQTTPTRGHISGSRTTSVSSMRTVTRVQDRTTFAFLMGWDGLGDSPFNGLTSTNDPYGTKPWFNSWQLELGYVVYEGDKFSGSIGIGYESDVYKFDNDNGGFIYLDRNDPSGKATMKVMSELELAAANMETSGWESRLCTRYITIPIAVDYDLTEDFGLGLTVIPGFSFSTSHTGLKYKLHGDNQSYLRDGLRGYVNPIKCDIRFNVKFSVLNLFVQVSPLSVFKDTDRDNVYPTRFGFMIKL